MQATIKADRGLFSYPKYWPHCYGTAPFLPMSKEEMDALGWDSCDVILVTGDAYVDHPSFGMAVIGRVLEAHGFRVGIIAQPDWKSKDDFMKLGKPNLYFGVTAGNMDSMINRYTSDKKLRHDDAYTPGNVGGKRPDRAVTVYSQRCREAFKGVPVIIGGIEASLRRIAHYDYWSEKVRRSVLFDSKADMLFFGNAERPLVEVTHRLAAGESIQELRDVRGTAIIVKEALPEWQGVDSTSLDRPGKIDPIPSPYQMEPECDSQDKDKPNENAPEAAPIVIQPATRRKPWENVYVKLPAFETVKDNKVLYAHTSRILHQETNPGCARALMQRHGDRHIWINPPAMPLETDEMDAVFDLSYQRVPHPVYGDAKIPAYDMIRFSINIMRGCYGGCTFCSITEHEGRIIQSRSEDSIIREIEQIRDTVPGFTGVISDLGGPTANMYRLRCKSPKAEATCRRPSCVYPSICAHMDTDHKPTIDLYRRARNLPGIKKILIASGVRYDLAIEDPDYVKELALHHVGGYLKIAPEHTEDGPLSKMMKPGMGTYHRFKELFDKYSREAGKKQYLIPYFIASHPGTTDEDMLSLAIWLKENKFKLDQVQNFYPSPMATATTMYHTEVNSLRKVTKDSEEVTSAKGEIHRRLHKAMLRYHDPKNFAQIRDALVKMGREDLIGRGPQHLVPPESADEKRKKAAKARRGERALTKHTGLPPQFQRADGEGRNTKGKSKPNQRKNHANAGGRNNPNQNNKSKNTYQGETTHSGGKSGNRPGSKQRGRVSAKR